ncbi:hypothetical protein ACU4GD_28845 [Cupriavidus basilensis]
MITDRQAARRTQQREALCAAAVRALTGDAALHYRDGRLCRQLRPLPLHAPHLRIRPEDDFTSQRGAADGAALRIAHSDADLHRQILSRGSHRAAGVRSAGTVALRIAAARRHARPGAEPAPPLRGLVRAFYRAGLAESHLGILLCTVEQIAWSRLSGWPVLEDTEDLIEATRAASCRCWACRLPVAPASRGAGRVRRACAGDGAAGWRDAAGRARRAGTGRCRRSGGRGSRAWRSRWRSVSRMTSTRQWRSRPPATAVCCMVRSRATAPTPRVDREISPGSLVRKALLAEYRERLDRRIAEQGINVARLGAALAASLAVPQRDGWSFGERKAASTAAGSRNWSARRPSAGCSGRSGTSCRRTAR